MSKLTLTKNSTGEVTAAAIDGVSVEGFVGVTQTLNRGNLSTQLTINFTDVEVVSEPVPYVGTLVAAFAEGSVADTTKATIVGPDGPGNHFAYKVGDTAFTTPTVADTITGSTLYLSGNDISGVDATTNKYVALYELTSENKAVKFLAHTLTADEIA